MTDTCSSRGIQREEFENLTKPLIKYLNGLSHPHMSIIITTDSAVIVEDLMSTGTVEFIKD